MIIASLPAYKNLRKYRKSWNSWWIDNFMVTLSLISSKFKKTTDTINTDNILTIQKRNKIVWKCVSINYQALSVIWMIILQPVLLENSCLRKAMFCMYLWSTMKTSRKYRCKHSSTSADYRIYHLIFKEKWAIFLCFWMVLNLDA